MHRALLTIKGELRDLRNFATFLEEATAVQRANFPRARSVVAVRVRELQEATADLSSASLARYSYSTLVVLLYGALERYVEALIEAYVVFWNRACRSYTDLPEPVRASHGQVTLALLQRVELRRYACVTTEAELVANLHSCLQAASGYRLNAVAFAAHQANLRSDLLQEMLSRVGITDAAKRVLADPVYGAAVDAMDPGAGASFSRINELADRRNDVSHGLTGDVLATSIMIDYMTLVEAFASALHACVTSAALEALVRFHAQAVGASIAVHGNRIVCFTLGSGCVRVGDHLVARGAGGQGLRIGTIESLQVNSVDHAVVDATAGSVDVGAKIGLRVKANETFWVVEAGAARVSGLLESFGL